MKLHGYWKTGIRDTVMENKFKMFFIGALLFTLWGVYKIGLATYTSIAWINTQGVIVDFDRNTWSCGKGVSECYSLIVGYHANNDYFTITGDKKFRNQPRELHGETVSVYYSPDNPQQAVLGGEYGPLRYGIISFLVGLVMLLISWFFSKRES